MFKIKPVLTEKTLKKAKLGEYTFEVSRSLDKNKARKILEDAFNVHIKSIRSITLPALLQKSAFGKKISSAKKKIVVKLAEGEKIDVFEELKK